MLELEVSTKELLHNILLQHSGRDKAITGSRLAQILGYRDDRRIRLLIRELITDGLPIASSTEKPGGYFIIASHAEAEAYANTVKSRLIEDAIRRRDFRRAAARFLEGSLQARLI